MDILTLTSDGTTGDVALRGTMSVSDDVTLTKDAVALTHNGSTSLAISSESGYVSITADGSYVDVESVRFTGDNIGLSNDVDILTLTSDGTTGDVALRGTMSVSDDVTLTKDAVALTHNGSTSLAISSESEYVSITADGSYVDVESVRFTGDNIGLSNDVDILTLTSDGTTGDVAVAGDVGISGTLNVQGDVTFGGAFSYGGDLNLTSTLEVTGETSLLDALTLKNNAATVAHTGSTSLAISSTNGYVSIAGATGSYVDVESVRITDAKIGLSSDADLITLTSGVATVAGKVHTTTLETTGAATLDSATVTNALGAGATTVSSLTTSGDLLMTEDAAVLTHSAASGTSLAISSTNGYVSIAGATGSYVDVESVRFTDAKIGVSGDPDLITLTSGDVAVAGTLSTTGAATLNSATVTNALGAGATSVTTLTTSGAATLASATVTGSLGVGGATGDATKKLYVTGDTETTGDLAIGGDATFAGTVTVTGTFTALDYRIGDSAPSDSLTVNAETNHTGPTTMSDTLDVVGATTLESSLALSADSAAITHSGSTSLAISSTNGYVSIAGATGSYVDVESVRITDAKIGVSGDPDLITLTSGDVAVARDAVECAGGRGDEWS